MPVLCGRRLALRVTGVSWVTGVLLPISCGAGSTCKTCYHYQRNLKTSPLGSNNIEPSGLALQTFIKYELVYTWNLVIDMDRPSSKQEFYEHVWQQDAPLVITWNRGCTGYGTTLDGTGNYSHRSISRLVYTISECQFFR